MSTSLCFICFDGASSLIIFLHKNAQNMMKAYSVNFRQREKTHHTEA
jgi:hypothetical protein